MGFIHDFRKSTPSDHKMSLPKGSNKGEIKINETFERVSRVIGREFLLEVLFTSASSVGSFFRKL